MLNAEFVAVIQVLVYAGAIMVLFLFVLMLLSSKDDEKYVKNGQLENYWRGFSHCGFSCK